MREIKFRVWDGEVMHYGDVFEFNSGIICYHSELDSVKEGCPIPEGHLMQFTGLKDKYGNEIYEGDICKASKANSYLNGRYKVIWNGKKGRWIYKGTEEYQVGSGGNLNCEVVGNIFEDSKS